MPTYDYECRQCQHRFELFQSITEDPVKVCPKCGKKSVRRLVGGGLGIIFKGSGFYTTDYKRSSALTSGNGSSRSSDGAEKSGPPKEKKPSTSDGSGSAAGSSGGADKS
jgi:putative FmdB family regulatory protein